MPVTLFVSCSLLVVVGCLICYFIVWILVFDRIVYGGWCLMQLLRD